MSRTLSLTRDDPYDSNRAARRAKLDVITAAMLTGGASGGWGMARALSSQTERPRGALGGRCVQRRPLDRPTAFPIRDHPRFRAFSTA